MPFNHLHFRPTIRLGALAYLLGIVAPFAVASDPPRVHIVREGIRDNDTVRKRVAALEAICRAGKEMPEAAPTPLPDSALQALPAYSVEEYFDGQRWAKYETSILLHPDDTAGCRPAAYFHRSVSVEPDCTVRLHASSPRPHPASPAPHPEAYAIKEQTVAGTACSKVATKRPENLPRADTGQGVTCVWASTVLNAMLGRTDITNQPSGSDFCQYAELPIYPQPGRLRPVVVMTHDPSPQPDNVALNEPRAVFAQRLKRLSVGGALPADAFTRDGMTRFVSLPAKRLVPSGS